MMANQGGDEDDPVARMSTFVNDVEVPYWVSSYMQSVNGYLQLDTVTCAQRNFV